MLIEFQYPWCRVTVGIIRSVWLQPVYTPQVSLLLKHFDTQKKIIKNRKSHLQRNQFFLWFGNFSKLVESLWYVYLLVFCSWYCSFSSKLLFCEYQILFSLLWAFCQFPSQFPISWIRKDSIAGIFDHFKSFSSISSPNTLPPFLARSCNSVFNSLMSKTCFETSVSSWVLKLFGRHFYAPLCQCRPWGTVANLINENRLQF